MKITLKQKLVDYMIANGNSFTYTGMIKALLKISKGDDFLYDWRSHRGYFATNFNSNHGYMTRGCGDCGVYKDIDGKWKAKYYTKEEKAAYKAKSVVRDLYYKAEKIIHDYLRSNREGWSQLEYQHFINDRNEARDFAVKKLVKTMINL